MNAMISVLHAAEVEVAVFIEKYGNVMK